MSMYRRYRLPGATCFLTLVTWNRTPLFNRPEVIDILRESVRIVLAEWPFTIDAAVILPDHLHFLWTMSPEDSDYSKRVGRMKAKFTQRLGEEYPELKSPLNTRLEASNWQPRFLEHTITDDRDFKNQLDYIHYNPVRHGLCHCAHDWPYSSFRKWVRSGEYDEKWACCCQGGQFDGSQMELIGMGLGE